MTLPECSVSLIPSIDVLPSMSLLVISMLFLSEYKKVANSKLASQIIARSFKTMSAIHCSQTVPKKSLERCAAPQVQRVSQKELHELCWLFTLSELRDAIWDKVVFGDSLIIRRNHGSDIYDYGGCGSLTQLFESLMLHGVVVGPHGQWLWGKFWSRRAQTLSLHWLGNLQFCKMEIWKIEWEEIQFWNSQKGIAKELISF